MKSLSEKNLLIRKKAVVFIDWANVYNWRKSLNKKCPPVTRGRDCF